MIKRHLITPWNLLALLAAVLGTIATLAVARTWLHQWAASGQKFPISRWGQVIIPPDAIETLVYYESNHSVERRPMRLYIRDRYGERYRATVPGDDNEFEIAGRQGRAVFRLDLEEGGTYDFRCDNPNYASDDEIPATDRVVFLKTPNTRAEALTIRRLALAGGGSLTVAATLTLYLLHALTLSRRKKHTEEV